MIGRKHRITVYVSYELQVRHNLEATLRPSVYKTGTRTGGWFATWSDQKTRKVHLAQKLAGGTHWYYLAQIEPDTARRLCTIIDFAETDIDFAKTDP